MHLYISVNPRAVSVQVPPRLSLCIYEHYTRITRDSFSPPARHKPHARDFPRHWARYFRGSGGCRSRVLHKMGREKGQIKGNMIGGAPDARESVSGAISLIEFAKTESFAQVDSRTASRRCADGLNLVSRARNFRAFGHRCQPQSSFTSSSRRCCRRTATYLLQ